MTACGNDPMDERDPLFFLAEQIHTTTCVFVFTHAANQLWIDAKQWPSPDETDSVSRRGESAQREEQRENEMRFPAHVQLVPESFTELRSFPRRQISSNESAHCLTFAPRGLDGELQLRLP